MFFPFQFPAWLLASPSTLRSPYCRPLAGVIHTLAYQSLPTSSACGEAVVKRRTEDRRVGLASGGTVERWRRFSSRGSCTRWKTRVAQRISLQLHHPVNRGEVGANVARQASRPRSRRTPIQLPTKFRASMISSGVAPPLSGVHVDLDMRDQVATRDARDDDQRL